LYPLIFDTILDKKTEHIGILRGKILLFGGVYSNLQALEKLQSIAEAENISPENCICTGDIVGYCGQPEETVQFFKNWGAKSIAGNVEIQLGEDSEDCGCDFEEGSRCDGFSQLWYPYAKSRLTKDSLDFIKTLPDFIQFQYAGKKVAVVHGSYSNVSEFIFRSTPWATKAENFEKTKSDIIIAGHCGLPFNHKQEDKIWLNPGVIGMPANDAGPHVWYMILNDEDNDFSFTHHKMSYDHKLTNELMNNGLLPKEYAKTILTGIWDNTEILPDTERSWQGFSIKL